MTEHQVLHYLSELINGILKDFENGVSIIDKLSAFKEIMKKSKFRIPDDFIGKNTLQIASILRNMDDVRMKTSLRNINIHANEYLSLLQTLLSFFL
jgi:hypothetical protein